ncbi:hypothetical protein IB223_17785 [Pseudoxanthomonas sp. PXM03]|uniref:hypothetical protein n=1 Tax=Pseudoxanthomonas sp. PXM03 TaxID=2769284 RepID=UPI00177F65C0|nr:hypothetical protein [Pseudoxanthomonas sp. PXM03]MBD9437954.1 hypothetical protein [Pseudoxanthomonas sp. PXM03]
MDMDEAIDRAHALDRWVCLYARSNTFAQFHADYATQDPELKAFLNATEHED